MEEFCLKWITHTVKIAVLILIYPFLANCQMPPAGDQFSISWEWYYADDLYMSSFEPAGVEYGMRIYLARGRVPHTVKWVTGKLLVRDKIVCKIGRNGTEIEAASFQVLMAPQGSVSWIPMPTNGEIPKTGIVSGRSDFGKRQYVCRAFDKYENLIPGVYAPYNKKCYIATDGKVHGARKGEILVVNYYAIPTAIENKTGYEYQIRDNSNPREIRNPIKNTSIEVISRPGYQTQSRFNLTKRRKGDLF